MKKRYLKLFVSIILLLSIALIVANAENAFVPGVYTGEATGFGGLITVTVEVDDHSIKSIQIDGLNETKGIGTQAIEALSASIVSAQSAQVDVVAGATYSSKGVLQALEVALNQATGKQNESTELKMAPGSYTATAKGYSQTRPIEVSVTVSEKKITDIQISSNKENVGILESVTDLMVPRILEQQNLNVDAICGATVSSNAVKAAVVDCVEQAIKAAGTDRDAIQHFNKNIMPEHKEEIIEVDVLVVGMGGSGSTAAMKAVESQKNEGREISVLAIDKAGKIGGTSCNTSVLQVYDSKVSEALFNNGESYFEKELVDKEIHDAMPFTNAQDRGWNIILNESGETLDWLIYHGFYFGTAKPGLAGKYPVTYEYNGVAGERSLAVTYDFFKNLIKDYTELGGKYMLETEGLSLIFDQDTRTVKGVKARNNITNTDYTIYAKSVVLATGGFGANDEMELNLYEGNQTGAYRHDISMMQNDGKMIQAALDIGAGTQGLYDCLDGVIWNIGVPNRLSCYDIIWKEESYDIFRDDMGAWSFNDIPEMMVNDWSGLFINPQGERFVNEAGVWAGKHNNGSLYYTLWSKDLLNYINENGFKVNFSGNFLTTSSMTSGVFPLDTGIRDMGADLYEIMEKCVETGNAIKADTLEELAIQAGMDPEILTLTVAEYNKACETGVDEKFGKPVPFLHAIGSEGPFYFLLAMPRAYSSGGGLDINDHFQVLHAKDKEPIGGLFAAGTDCLGFTPPFFYGGEYLSWVLTSGRIVGQNASRYAAGLSFEDPEDFQDIDYLQHLDEIRKNLKEIVDTSAPTDFLRK